MAHEMSEIGEVHNVRDLPDAEQELVPSAPGIFLRIVEEQFLDLSGKLRGSSLLSEKLRRPRDEHMVALIVAHPASDQRKNFFGTRPLQFAAHLVRKGIRLLLAIDMHGETAHIVQELCDELFLHILSPKKLKQASDEVDVLQGLENLAA